MGHRPADAACFDGVGVLKINENFHMQRIAQESSRLDKMVKNAKESTPTKSNGLRNTETKP